MNDFLKQINPHGKRMVLTVDGGGVKGILPACCLSRLEALSGKKCNEIFEFMSGTSVGALIAAALAKGVPASELVRIFTHDSKKLFKPTSRFRPYTRLLKSKYDKTHLQGLLKDLLGDTVLRELPVGILITSKDVKLSRTIYFTDRGRFEHEPLRLVAERSMSAPYYFRPVEQYIDGGVGGYNNTCHVTAIEIFKYRNFTPADTIMMSFGTGEEVNKMTRQKAGKTTGIGWASYVLGEGMQDANEEQVYLNRTHYPNMDFRRYQLRYNRETMQQLKIGIPDKDLKGISLDSVGLMREMKRIGIIFSEEIDFTQSLELPRRD